MLRTMGKIILKLSKKVWKSDQKHHRYGEICEKYKDSQKPAKNLGIRYNQ